MRPRLLRTAPVLALLLGCAAAAPPDPSLLSIEGKDLRGTVVLAHEEQPIPEGKGAIWCAASRLAWDAFPRKAPGSPVALGKPADPAVVSLLDRAPFPAGALDPASFVALGGFDDRGVLDAIRDAVRTKFSREPDLPPMPRADWNAVAYACLAKALPFEHPFERADAPLRFAGGTKDLAAFRVPEEGSREAKDRVRRQVRVLFAGWKSRNAFEGACSIPSKGGGDRLVLALVPRGRSLKETWDSVASRAAAGSPGPLDPDAAFLVPLANFDLRHRFADLEGGAADVGRGAPATLVLFREDIRFQLKETGVKLEAEAVMVAPGSAVGPADPPPRFVFDRPFLLALVREGSKDPYFLWWVGDDELLCPMP